MSLTFDPIIARLRHEEMLLEAERIRFAKRAAKFSGADTLLGRMVKLFSRSSRPVLKSRDPDSVLPQHQWANAKGS